MLRKRYGDGVIADAIKTNSHLATVIYNSKLLDTVQVEHISNTVFHTILADKPMSVDKKVSMLTDKKCDLNVKDDKGNTVLHVICSDTRHTKKESELLFKTAYNPTADLTIANKDGNTVFDIATKRKLHGVLELLNASI